jgi:methyl-accepting chemotaxis protein
MHWTVRQRLYALGTLGLCFTLAMGISGLYGISKVARGTADISRNGDAIRNHLEATAFLDVTRSDLSKVLVATEDSRDDRYAELVDHAKLLSDRMAQVLDLTQAISVHGNLQDESGKLQDYLDQINRISSLRAKPAEAMPLMGPFVQSYSDLRNTMEQGNDLLQAQSKRDAADSARVVKLSEEILALICVCSLLILSFISVSTARNIANRLALIVLRLKQLAEGDLTQTVDDNRKDELGELARWFNQGVTRLHDTMSRVTSSTDQVSKASERLSAAATHTAEKAVRQRDHTDQVATAMRDMVDTVHHVSENSQRAAGAAQQASETATAGGDTVEQSIQEMRQIAGSVAETARRVKDLVGTSRQISEIVQVIDEIADQTNLLALNASIEAARAGDHGRGFAVVADEVRKLAERTGGATKEISTMIKKIQSETERAVRAMSEGTEKASQGVAKAENAGEALKEIIRMAQGVGDMVAQIATAATEQSSTTAEINVSVEQIAAISRETGEASSESAGACTELSTLVEEVRKLMGQFTLREAVVSSAVKRNGARKFQRLVRAEAPRESIQEEVLEEVGKPS